MTGQKYQEYCSDPNGALHPNSLVKTQNLMFQASLAFTLFLIKIYLKSLPPMPTGKADKNKQKQSVMNVLLTALLIFLYFCAAKL